jgi:hypothetical protein
MSGALTRRCARVRVSRPDGCAKYGGGLARLAVEKAVLLSMSHGPRSPILLPSLGDLEGWAEPLGDADVP